MWLENTKNKQARIIRLVRADLDWSNWVKRDQQFTADQAEKLRKHLFARSLNVLNIYVTEYPPVDNQEFLLEKPITAGQGKTELSSIIFARENAFDAMSKIGGKLGKSLNSPLEVSMRKQMFL